MFRIRKRMSDFLKISEAYLEHHDEVFLQRWLTAFSRLNYFHKKLNHGLGYASKSGMFFCHVKFEILM